LVAATNRHAIRKATKKRRRSLARVQQDAMDAVMRQPRSLPSQERFHLGRSEGNFFVNAEYEFSFIFIDWLGRPHLSKLALVGGTPSKRFRSRRTYRDFTPCCRAICPTDNSPFSNSRRIHLNFVLFKVRMNQYSSGAQTTFSERALFRDTTENQPYDRLFKLLN
jgi:hypothetical protein